MNNIGPGPQLTNSKSILLMNEAIELYNNNFIKEATQKLFEINLLEEFGFNDSNYQLIYGLILLTQEKYFLSLTELQKSYYRNKKNIITIEFLINIYFKIGDIKNLAYFSLKKLHLLQWKDKEDCLVIGDSHSHFLFSGVASAIVDWIGPVTMFRISNDTEIIERYLANNQFKYIILCFGEIDSRAHVNVQSVRQGKSINEIIIILVNNYIKKVVKLSYLANKLGKKIAICSVVPPLNCLNNSTIPFNSQINERSLIVNKINEELRIATKDKNIYYIDTHKYYSDLNSFGIQSYSDGNIHFDREFNDIMEYEIEYMKYILSM